MNREGDDAEWFYRVVMQPTVTEFLAHPDDMRRGVLAALVVSHIAEHYFEARKPIQGSANTQAFRQSLRDENGAYRLIADVADATKHVLRGRQNGRQMAFEDVEARRIDFSNLRCGWPFAGIQVMVRDGDTVWLLSRLIKAATEMWEAKLDLKEP
jgi:hypothetical protein